MHNKMCTLYALFIFFQHLYKILTFNLLWGEYNVFSQSNVVKIKHLISFQLGFQGSLSF